MVAPPKSPYITPEEYLDREKSAETKSEYFDGIVFDMAGASLEHNTIAVNAVSEIHQQLKGKTCRSFSSDMRVSIPACRRYFYPDISVACNGPQFETIDGVQSLINPTLVIEVLSDSTEQLDRGDKFQCYLTINSLQVYDLISQSQPSLEWFTRCADGSWIYRKVSSLDDIVDFPEAGFQLALADVYDRIAFDTPDA